MTDRNDKTTAPGSNVDFEGVDKAPGEEQGHAEKVKMEDLKGKKNDGDPEKKEDQPIKQRE